MTLIWIVSFVLCHILEVPLILGLDFYFLQVDLTVSVEDHHELPPWDKTRHHESALARVFLPHIKPMKVQGTASHDLVPRFDPGLIRLHPGDSPVFEFCRRRNDTRGDGDLKLCHLIKPSLVLSRCLAQPLTGLRCDQEQESIRWGGMLTAERFRMSSTSQSLNIFNNTSKGRSASSRD